MDIILYADTILKAILIILIILGWTFTLSNLVLFCDDSYSNEKLKTFGKKSFRWFILSVILTVLFFIKGDFFNINKNVNGNIAIYLSNNQDKKQLDCALKNIYK